MTRRFNVTYEIVTPESAERGDHADCGFIDAQGSPHSVNRLWAKPTGDLKRQCAMRLRDALQLVYPQEGDGFTFREVDGRQDYRTGAESRRALHAPDNITSASLARLSRVLGF